nr:retrovirus-related Pol polyprotein from transposon TNT 1-94 [Tanacetum cinerariifolium]
MGPDGHKTYGKGVSTLDIFGDRSALRNVISSDAIERMVQVQVDSQLDEITARKGSATTVGTSRQCWSEAEYIAASEAEMEAVWIRKFNSRLGIAPTINEPIKMFCDNSSVLLIANEPGVQRGARYYHRRCHYVCECIELGEINLLKVHTDDNLVDPFTKALPKGKLTQHVRIMRLRLASSFIRSPKGNSGPQSLAGDCNKRGGGEKVDVGIKSLFDVVGITAAQVYVNTALMKLVLLMNFKK